MKIRNFQGKVVGEWDVKRNVVVPVQPKPVVQPQPQPVQPK